MISLVIASQNERDAEVTLASFESSRVEFQPIVVTGAATILDAYRIGQSKAEHDLVVYAHNDFCVYQGMLEPTLRYLFDGAKNLGWIGIYGSTKPVACGMPYHARAACVGMLLAGVRGMIDTAGRLNGILGLTTQIDIEAVNMGVVVSTLDGCFLATNRRDWNFENTNATSFLGSYEADICFEALERGMSNFVLPIRGMHFASYLSPAEIEKRDAFVSRSITQNTVDRWRAVTVPCGYTFTNCIGTKR